MFVNEVAYAALQFVNIDEFLIGVINSLVNFCLSLNITHCIIGIIASIMTMLMIVSKKRVRDSRIRSCYIICLMNVPYLFSVFNYALSRTIFERFGYFFLAFVAVSCFTSMLNPLIIVLLNKELKQFVMFVICNVRRSYLEDTSNQRAVKLATKVASADLTVHDNHSPGMEMRSSDI